LPPGSSVVESASESMLEMIALMKQRKEKALQKQKATTTTTTAAATTAKKKLICDGEMAGGGPNLAEGILQRLQRDGYKSYVKYLTDDRLSWVLHCPGWCKMDRDSFNALWELHPEEFNEIMMFGKRVKIPRWQQAYGQSYSFSGATAIAMEKPPKDVAGLMERVNDLISCFKFKMALLNWYAPDHYLGPHHDDVKQLVKGSPIVSMSWGQTRSFRLIKDKKRPSVGAINTTIDLRDGDLLLMSWGLNVTHKHEVMKLSKSRQVAAGGRINVTMRSFKDLKSKA